MTWEQDREPVESGGPEDRLLTWNKVRDVTGLSRSTAWRLQRLGDFPEPVRISVNRVGWWESELTAWKGARGTTRALVPPSRPRLPGMPRRAPGRSSPAASNGGCEREEISESLVNGPVRRPERKRRARPVHVDQIDFGF